MNKCLFLGRLTKDVELRYAGSDNTAFGNFTLAVERKFKKDGQPTADFLNFVAIGKTAEVMAKYCQKGSLIAVTSRVQTRTWDDTEGKKHYTTEFVVEEFSFAGGNNKANSSQETSSEEEEFVL
jgi:single-strand DNA-binding protein